MKLFYGKEEKDRKRASRISESPPAEWFFIKKSMCEKCMLFFCYTYHAVTKECRRVPENKKREESKMELLTGIIFLGAGMLSFLIYRLGIKDGYGLRENSPPEPLIKIREQHNPGKEERDFLNQYSELMNYSFDRVGDSDE